MGPLHTAQDMAAQRFPLHGDVSCEPSTHQHTALERLGQLLQPGHFVDRRSNNRKLQPVRRANIAVQHRAKAQADSKIECAPALIGKGQLLFSVPGELDRVKQRMQRSKRNLASPQRNTRCQQAGTTAFKNGLEMRRTQGLDSLTNRQRNPQADRGWMKKRYQAAWCKSMQTHCGVAHYCAIDAEIRSEPSLGTS